MINYTTPGVFIEEIPATGPIPGVGTSTVAFIGPTLFGPINTPTRITNWTQFKTLFGDYALDPAKRFFTPYAVRGFFSNGGTIAYMVRVGTAKTAFLNLNDRASSGSAPTLVITAQRDGSIGNSIQVGVQNAQIVNSAQNASVQKARAAITSAANNQVTLQNASDASQFRSGDVITIEGSAERTPITQIQGNQLILASNLTGTYGATAFVRIADLVANQKTFRIQNSSGIESGSVINLAQGSTQETHIVDDLVNNFVTLSGNGLTNAYQLTQAAAPIAITTTEFTLTVAQPSAQPPISEQFPNLSMDPRHNRYFSRIVNSQLVNSTLPTVPNTQPPPNNIPAPLNTTFLAGGADDQLGSIGVNQYQNALTALTSINDANLICLCVRDQCDPSMLSSIQAAAIAHCEQKQDRFAILDAAQGSSPSGSNNLTTQVGALVSKQGYAAFYYPWLLVNDPAGPTGNETLLVPPSGHLAGIYARSDSQRGVHKAPANEFITGARGLETLLSDTDQGVLNNIGVNVLRIFPGQPPVVWGARTTAPLDQVAWRYINVRRLFIFVEQSLIESLRWAVFEPNNPGLWKKLERTISEFLSRVWRSGALFGKKASDAFYVKIDEELNPPSVQELGQIIIEIGIAPVRPAEFVIVRVAMWDGGSQTSAG
ncbi:phage tail sheath subtilisin-like domain-containing protein [Dictyobacter formicarum]|uniref:Tail protein n=1 Tax=Dictyobacter formicarum TaxID=2778368 RepID=A0ABQ3VBL2_9CHLR|nr:phage tail sheath subtilisin-like domain-containing protein [Dictyobacter formicarum]GHO83194.1 hypothetical protein KSZ_12000 [Dictyobacter formicarum]